MVPTWHTAQWSVPPVAMGPSVYMAIPKVTVANSA